jgi:3'-phosphoadenosine 5'-phosphosulfate sulfotransferase (PAPS reductase)/FAD synthetase
VTGYLPTLEPDFDVKQELRFIGGVLDLRQFDKIFVSVSGGKDSHAMLFLVKELAEKQGCSGKLVAMYADTGMEWHNAEDHVRRICLAAKVPLEIVYPVRPMLEKIAFRISQVQKNGKSLSKVAFPSPMCRYCTSAQKCSPMDNYMRKYSGRLLKATGERWEESKARSVYSEFVKLDRLNTKSRTVYGWRPMLKFTTEDVFQMVKDSGVDRHTCYDLGCDRLGCAGCIFSSDRELKIEMANNPHIFEALDKLETDSGFTMSMTGKKIRERIK